MFLTFTVFCCSCHTHTTIFSKVLSFQTISETLHHQTEPNPLSAFFFFGIAPDLFFAKSKTEHVGFYICTGLTSFSKVEGRCPSFTLTLEERRFVTYELKLTSYLWVTPPPPFFFRLCLFPHTVSLIYSSYGFLTRLRCTMSMFTSLYGRL